MTRTGFSLLLLIAMSSPAGGQPAAIDLEKEKAAIVQAALDYAEGYYAGEPSRMARAVSPYLSKRGLLGAPNVAPILVQMNADTLIDVSNGVKLPAAERHISPAVLAVDHEVASARVFTAQFNDYLHLVKRDGTWQILSVLWHRPPAPAASADAGRDAVEQAVREYAGALFAADGRRALAVLHPLANLRSYAQAPGRARTVREQNPDTLAAGLTVGQVKMSGTLEDVRVIVDGVDVDIATARMTIGPVPTYLHLALQDGRWRVVNALAYPPPPPAGTANR